MALLIQKIRFLRNIFRGRSKAEQSELVILGEEHNLFNAKSYDLHM